MPFEPWTLLERTEDVSTLSNTLPLRFKMNLLRGNYTSECFISNLSCIDSEDNEEIDAYVKTGI